MNREPPKSTPPERKRKKSVVDGELDLLAAIRARASQAARGGSHSALRLGIGDDCALLRLRPGEELALTTDLSIAGRHFRLDWHAPEAIGHRTLARGLSDLAAMGARPVAAFLSLGLPRGLTGDWLNRFLDGFFSLALAHQTPLAGGDLAESPIPVADIVLAGAVPRGKALLRSGARAGDLLYVTGALGGAAAGLRKLEQLAKLDQLAARQSRARREAPSFRRSQPSPARPQPPRIPAHLAPLLAAHLAPQPRIAQGLWLARRASSATGASAAIDLSDGLSTDLAHLCQASGVAAQIDEAALPIAPGATQSQALHGGESYELLFAAPPSARIPRRIAGVPVARIGRILRARGSAPQVTLVTSRGSEALGPGGWKHFS